jgi:hypothetical protein
MGPELAVKVISTRAPVDVAEDVLLTINDSTVTRPVVNAPDSTPSTLTMSAPSLR